MLIAMCTTTLLMVGEGLIQPYFVRADRIVRMVALIACGALQFACVGAWYSRNRLGSVRRRFDEAPPSEPSSPAPAAEPEQSNLFENTRWSDLSLVFRSQIMGDLISEVSERRRHAVHVLSSLADSPIALLDCWPVLNCTRLRFAAAEAILREWAEYLESPKSLTEGQLIHLMFPVEEIDQVEWPRVRKIAVHQPETSAAAPTNLEKTLDRWNDAVKDAILDRPGEDEENEFSSPDEDQPLRSLDPGQFTAALPQQVAALAEHIAATPSP